MPGLLNLFVSREVVQTLCALSSSWQLRTY